MREGDAPAGDAGKPGDAPGLEDAFRAIGAEGRAGLKAASDATRALRSLVAADIALARSALVRTLALAAVAIAFGASAWLLLMATLVFVFQGIGLSLLVALLVCALLSTGITIAAGWYATRYFAHTRLQATRRQFARLGFGELAEPLADAGSDESAAGQRQQASANEPIRKDLGVDLTSP